MRRPDAEIEEAIRPGGLAPTKSVRIKRILDAIGDDDLQWLAEAPLAGEPRLPLQPPGRRSQDGGLRLMFSFDLPDIPVDTHVYRVGTRLGLFRPKASLEEAHDELLRVVDPEDAYEIHVLLIRHGRRTCHARNPRCAECPLRRMCPEGKRRLAAR